MKSSGYKSPLVLCFLLCAAMSGWAEEGKPARSYKQGLELLARELPFDPTKAVYGKFAPSDENSERSFTYRGQRFEDLAGNGWLTETDGRSVFWLDSLEPMYVELQQKTPASSTAVAGKFTPQDLKQDLIKMAKEVKEKGPEEILYTGSASVLLITAAILNAQGEVNKADHLASFAFRAPDDREGDPVQLASAAAINSVAEAKYMLAMNRDAALDLRKLRTELSDLLKRYEGCYYFGAAVRELEGSITKTLESSQPSPFLTWKYTKADQELLNTASTNFWLTWNPAQLAKYGDSPIASLIRKGVEAVPELQTMLQDDRLVPLVDRENSFDMGYYDFRSITNAPSATDVQERYQRLNPRPLRVKDLATRILGGIFGNASGQMTGMDQEGEPLEDKTARFYASYKGLSGSKLAEAIITSDDLATKEAMIGALMEGDPKFLGPLLQKYVSTERPSQTMLQYVTLFARNFAETSQPVVEAFLARAPDSKALAKMISDEGGQAGDNPFTTQIAGQIDRLKMMVKPMTPDSLIEQMVENPYDSGLLRVAMRKMEPATLTKAILARLSSGESPGEAEALLGALFYLKLPSESEEEADAGKQADFIKLILEDRKTWETVFANRKRGEWGVVGDSAVSLVFNLASEGNIFAEANPLLGGKALLRFQKKAMEEYWTNKTPVPRVPTGKDYPESGLPALKAEALAAPDLSEWLKTVPLDKGLALPIAAATDPELTKRLKPIVTHVDEVVIDAPAGPTVEKARALEGKSVSTDALVDLIESSIKERLTLSISRSEVPSPITITVVKPQEKKSPYSTPHIQFHTFNSVTGELDSKPTVIPNSSSGRVVMDGPAQEPDLKDIRETIRQSLEEQIGPEAKSVGLLWIRYSSE